MALFPVAPAFAQTGGSTQRLTVSATVMMNCRLHPSEPGLAEVRCTRGALPKVEGCHGGCPADPQRRAFGILERTLNPREDGRRVVTVLF
ncbi:MAG TPA: hypothetical protein VNU21_15365 [Usitatibacter sp.]|jgi:hypothetical protein|nr:hypothetical protein [Usitatibacter sp.]